MKDGSESDYRSISIKKILMQMNSSYVVTDPKGSVMNEAGKMLADNGYEIRTLNISDMSKSLKYNPFAYIHSERDILKLVNVIITNTQAEGTKEDFWVKTEGLLFSALIGYIFYEAPRYEQNFSTLITLIDSSEASVYEDFKNAVDILFENLEFKNPDHFAVRQYKKYKLVVGRNAKEILISCRARLAPFDIESVKALMEYDELELSTIGERKTALFVVTSETDKTNNFIVAIMYYQILTVLCEKADKQYKGKLPVGVQLILSDLTDIGKIPNIEYLIAILKGRAISVSLILKQLKHRSELENMYSDSAKMIIQNCDTTIFLDSDNR